MNMLGSNAFGTRIRPAHGERSGGEGGGKRIGRRCVTLALGLFIMLCLFLSACGDVGRGDVLGYGDGELSATVTMTCNGAESAFRYTEMHPETGAVSRIIFEAPDELCGFEFRTENGETVIVCEGLTVDAPEALTLLPELMHGIFSLESSAVTSISAEKDGDVTLTRVTVDGVTVYLDSEGFPVRIEGVLCGVEFTALITDFSPESEPGAEG